MADKDVANLFFDSFGFKAHSLGFSPGRVNLIGEHTDYNGGLVLPTALTIGLDIALSPRNDDQINIVSNGFDAMSQRQLGERANNHWSDYVLGGLNYANQADFIKGGADIAIYSNLPHGAGLSSSAALIVGLLKLSCALSGQTVSEMNIAKLARRVENEFIGVPCGIMDQVAVAIARPGQALLLDTKALTYEIILLPDSHNMMVIHSGHFRQLNEGRYKERKEECDIIKAATGREDICRMSDAKLDELYRLPSHIQRRARHCVSEHRRTEQAALAIQQGNLDGFGKLMTESHASMRKDFDITIPEIDALVEDAVALGASGARMTGGGFGGCIIACVPKDKSQAWADALLAKHPKAFYVN